MGVYSYHEIQEDGFGEPKLLTRSLGKNVLLSAKAEGSDFYLANLFWGVGGFVRVFSCWFISFHPRMEIDTL
jgi:hypothetical protein